MATATFAPGLSAACMALVLSWIDSDPSPAHLEIYTDSYAQLLGSLEPAKPSFTQKWSHVELNWATHRHRTGGWFTTACGHQEWQGRRCRQRSERWRCCRMRYQSIQRYLERCNRHNSRRRSHPWLTRRLLCLSSGCSST